MIGDISVGYTLVPLDKVDLSLVSVLYTQVGGPGGPAGVGRCDGMAGQPLAAVLAGETWQPPCAQGCQAPQQPLSSCWAALCVCPPPAPWPTTTAPGASRTLGRATTPP